MPPRSCHFALDPLNAIASRRSNEAVPPCLLRSVNHALPFLAAAVPLVGRDQTSRAIAATEMRLARTAPPSVVRRQIPRHTEARPVCLAPQRCSRERSPLLSLRRQCYRRYRRSARTDPAPRGFSDLFDYAAQRRIQTMRLCRRHGWVRAMLRSGELSVTATAQMETAFAAAERACRRAIPNAGLESCHDLPGLPASPSAACNRAADESGAGAGEAGAAAMTGSAAHGLVAAGREARSPRDAGGGRGGREGRRTGSDRGRPSSNEPAAVAGRPSTAGALLPVGRLQSSAAAAGAAPASAPERVPDRPDSNTAAAHPSPQAAPERAARTGLAGEVAATTPVVPVARHAAAQHRARHADAPSARLQSNGVATPSPAPARAPTCAPSRAPGLAAPSSDQGPAAPLLPATSRPAPIPVPVVAPAQPRPPAAPAPEPSRGDPTTELPAGPVTAAALLHPRRQREIIEQAAGMTTRQVAGLLGDRRSAGGAAARHAARGGAGPLHLEGEHRPGVRAGAAPTEGPAVAPGPAHVVGRPGGAAGARGGGAARPARRRTPAGACGQHGSIVAAGAEQDTLGRAGGPRPLGVGAVILRRRMALPPPPGSSRGPQCHPPLPRRAARHPLHRQRVQRPPVQRRSAPAQAPLLRPRPPLPQRREVTAPVPECRAQPQGCPIVGHRVSSRRSRLPRAAARSRTTSLSRALHITACATDTEQLCRRSRRGSPPPRRGVQTGSPVACSSMLLSIPANSAAFSVRTLAAATRAQMCHNPRRWSNIPIAVIGLATPNFWPGVMVMLYPVSGVAGHHRSS